MQGKKKVFLLKRIEICWDKIDTGKKNLRVTIIPLLITFSLITVVLTLSKEKIS